MAASHGLTGRPGSIGVTNPMDGQQRVLNNVVDVVVRAAAVAHHRADERNVAEMRNRR